MVDFSGRAARAVRFQPVLPLGAALGGGRASGARPFPLDQPRVLLTFSGTAGIYQAFRAIGLRPGAVVLCPSYNCGHEIEPLIRLGLRVRCYRVGGDLEVDLDDLRRRMDREVKAVLVTHYFGFGQPLDELKTLCDRRGVFLVEDCAHALFSDNASGDLGRAGDAAVYSIRKTLPLPNGGAVLFNNPGIPMPAPLDPPPMLTTWLKALDLTRKSVVDRVRRDGSWTGLLPMAAMVPLVGSRELLIRLHPAQGTACYDPDDENLGFDSRIMDWSMSPYSAALLNRIDAGGIAARRRHNYTALAAGLLDVPGVRLLRPELPDRTCPLFLPVEVENRVQVFRHLVRHRIYPGVWWDERHPAVDWNEFPEAAALKERVLALPVHQDIDDEQVAHVVRAMREVVS